MFYSHELLEKKGPFGIVWRAAHLQHKFKKSHYISTNVPYTVGSYLVPFSLYVFYFLLIVLKNTKS